MIALDTLGLSHSRNAALQHAETDLLVFSDDDTILFPNGIQALAHNLTMKPDLALAVGWRAERLPPRAQRADLTHFNCGRVCAPEFMVRRSLILNAGVLFDTDFGLGARFGVGEEYVFVTDALHKGLRGIILPVVTGSHPEKSTGDKWDSTTILADRRAVLYRVFGAWAPVVSALYALKHCRKFTSIKAIIHFLLPIK
ncbi:glycosyltransferase family 2 protein [Tritonibacter mobilis]|uniref:glycosyltransferase family 2 protein n=1 Tax=Tritonibacter mobilis TaxID=379347 RepID=UPI0013A59502|nr:glycosyltransferase family A protein [Tritonibacter mobilis]